MSGKAAAPHSVLDDACSIAGPEGIIPGTHCRFDVSSVIGNRLRRQQKAAKDTNQKLLGHRHLKPSSV